MKTFKDFVIEAIQTKIQKGSIDIMGAERDTKFGDIFDHVLLNIPLRIPGQHYYHITGPEETGSVIEASERKLKTYQISCFSKRPHFDFVKDGITDGRGPVLVDFDDAELMLYDTKDLWSIAYGNRRRAKERYFHFNKITDLLSDYEADTDFIALDQLALKDPIYKVIFDAVVQYKKLKYEFFVNFVNTYYPRVIEILDKTSEGSSIVNNWMGGLKKESITFFNEFKTKLTSTTYDVTKALETHHAYGNGVLLHEIISHMFKTIASIKNVFERDGEKGVVTPEQNKALGEIERLAHTEYYKQMDEFFAKDLGNGKKLIDKIHEIMIKKVKLMNDGKVVNMLGDNVPGTQIHEGIIRNFHIKELTLCITAIVENNNYYIAMTGMGKFLALLKSVGDSEVPVRIVMIYYNTMARKIIKPEWTLKTLYAKSFVTDGTPMLTKGARVIEITPDMLEDYKE